MEHVCPWWLGYFLINPLRRLYQNPRKILSPYVKPGNAALEPGPGMGFFTLDIAQMVGSSGKVVTVDIQQKMLDTLVARAKKAGVPNVIETRLVAANKMGIDDLAGKIDFALAFAMIHELPDADSFLKEVYAALKPGAITFVAEPKGHVSKSAFSKTMDKAKAAGFKVEGGPKIWGSHTAILRK